MTAAVSDLHLQRKVTQAIKRLQTLTPSNDQPYYVCYSGGKDSDCIRLLCEDAGVPYELHHNHTTLDAPETVYYIRSIEPEVVIHYPEHSIWKLIVDYGLPPTRIQRYCCSVLKERMDIGKGRLKVMGVRAAESARRRRYSALFMFVHKPRKVEKTLAARGITSFRKGKKAPMFDELTDDVVELIRDLYPIVSHRFNPIIDWTDDDVWGYLKAKGCESNPLYKQGVKRVGCICCPMVGGNKRVKDLDVYPAYRQAFMRAFDSMIKRRAEIGRPFYKWKKAQDVMDWWLYDFRDSKGQCKLFKESDCCERSISPDHQH